MAWKKPVNAEIDGDACPQTGKLTFSYASGKKPTSLTWKSSDSSIASVDSNGNVTARAGCNICEVGAIDSTGMYATCWVAVWSECEWKMVDYDQEACERYGITIINNSSLSLVGRSERVFDSKIKYTGRKYQYSSFYSSSFPPYEVGDNITYNGETYNGEKWEVYSRDRAKLSDANESLVEGYYYTIRRLGDYCDFTETVLNESNGYYNVVWAKFDKYSYCVASNPLGFRKSLFQ